MSEQEQPKTELELTVDAIKRIKVFDPSSLVREEDLGRELAFKDAVEPAQRIINLYGQIALDALDDFPEELLATVKSQAEQHYKFFDNILEFSSTQENAAVERETLLTQLRDNYNSIFSQLQLTIAYSAQRVTDFGRLEKEAGLAIRAIEDKTKAIVDRIEKAEVAVDTILENVRQAAGELGVSQQAVHFDASVKAHNVGADKWHSRLLFTGTVLGVYAFSTLFFHKIPWLQAADPIQLVVSKVLIFAVISSYLFVCIRNYTSHKHNAIVDKHRQNALLTYKALVDAAGETPNSEVILVHAAACIFGPQGTGFTKDNVAGQSGVQQAVELFTSPIRGGDR